MRSAVLLLLGAAVSIIAAEMVDPPAAWAAKIARGDMLFAAAPPDSDLMPSVENGFLGGDVGCRSCYNLAPPSSPARRIPSPGLDTVFDEPRRARTHFPQLPFPLRLQLLE